jgi:hypothetical protein
MNHHKDDDIDWLSSSQQSSSPHYFQTFPPESHFIAQGTLEQLRRSKLTRIWKPVLVSLMKQGSPVVLIQRAETQQTLHQFPIDALLQVNFVEDDALTAGEHRFVIRLVSTEEEIVLRCPRNREAARNWVSTLRLVGQLLQKTSITTPVHEDNNLISFDDPVSPKVMPQVSQPTVILPSNQQRPLHPQQQPTFHHPQHQHLHHQHRSFPLPHQSTVPQQHYNFPQHYPQPSWNNRPRQYSPGYVMHHPPPAMHPPAAVPSPATRIYSAPVSQPVRPSPLPNPPFKPQPQPLHRSFSAPPVFKTTSQNMPPPKAPPITLTPAQLKERVTRDWALRPPAYQCLRDLTQLLPTLHHNFALVQHHAYFDKWIPLSSKNCEKSMRQVRFFLHPDKWPRDMSTEQTYLLKLLWDVINDAWEAYQQQEQVS